MGTGSLGKYTQKKKRKNNKMFIMPCINVSNWCTRKYVKRTTFIFYGAQFL